MSNVLPLDAIVIDRDSRQRRELRDIPALADSIARIGLIHPPVVTRERKLVAGERRITAMRLLGMTATPVTYTDELDPAALHVIELEENIRRADLSWQDEVRAVRDYHNLRKGLAIDTGEPWSTEQTAEAIGIDRRNIQRYIAVAEELDTGNPLVAEAQSKSVAVGLVERNTQRRQAEEAYRLTATARPAQAPAPSAEGPSPTEAPAPKAPPSPILHADFLEWAPAYSGDPFNFLHCDFPYGVEAGKRKQGSSTLKHGSYDDSADVYWTLLETLASNLDRIVAPSAHLMFWFSMDYYSETLRFFNSRTDFIIQPFPIYWWKTDNTGLLPDPKRGPRRVVETALIGSRGDRHIVQAVANCFGHATDRSDHMSIKPEPMLQHFFRMFVDGHSSVLDPTCGSGASIIAARAAGARRFTGLERDADFASRAQQRFARATGNGAA